MFKIQSNCLTCTQKIIRKVVEIKSNNNMTRLLKRKKYLCSFLWLTWLDLITCRCDLHLSTLPCRPISSTLPKQRAAGFSNALTLAHGRVRRRAAPRRCSSAPCWPRSAFARPPLDTCGSNLPKVLPTCSCKSAVHLLAADVARPFQRRATWPS